MRFETNRPLSGMGHEPYNEPPSELLVRPVDELARRLFAAGGVERVHRSEEHTSELQSLMRISYSVFCLKKKKLVRMTISLKNIQTSIPSLMTTNITIPIK